MGTEAGTSRVVAALQSGNFVHAEACCRMALDQEPDDADLLLLLGLALERQGRSDEALASLKRLTRLYPGVAMHWGNYATILHRAGDPEAAVAACRTAADLAPDEVKYQRQLGELLLSGGDAESARAVLLQAVERAPTDPVARLDAAHACLACGDVAAADVLREWRQWRPDDDTLRCQLAELLARAGNVPDALELLEDLVRRHPDDVGACLLLAKVCERVNRVTDAAAWLAHVEQAASADNADVSREIKLQRARLAARERDFDAARQLLEQAGPAHAADDGYYFALAGLSTAWPIPRRHCARWRRRMWYRWNVCANHIPGFCALTHPRCRGPMPA